jgi:hypothetical protein
MTVPISRSEEAPTIGGLHEDNVLGFFRVLGDRLRLTATADTICRSIIRTSVT